MDFESYKRNIRLAAFAEEVYGFERDVKKSSQRQQVLFHPFWKDKIVVSRDQAGTHDWYFNPANEYDKGTLIDFIFHREDQDWQLVRERLAGYQPNPSQVFFPPSPPPSLDFEAAFRPLSDLSYLAERGLNQATLFHPFFQDRIVEERDEKGFHYWSFPLYHFDHVLGVERRNKRFKGLAPGSLKGQACWHSLLPEAFEAVEELLLCESPIDALSYHQLFPVDQGRIYLSTSGQAGHGQIAYVLRLMERYPFARLTLGFDRDKAGAFQAFRFLQAMSWQSTTNWRIVSLVMEQAVKIGIRFIPIEDGAVFLGLLSSLLKTEVDGVKTEMLEESGLFSLRLPAEAEALYTSFDMMKKALGFREKIEVHLPQGKDFNEDLSAPYSSAPD